jgi:Helix-turn-helix domain
VCFKEKIAVLMSASPGGLGGSRGLIHIRSILGNIWGSGAARSKGDRTLQKGFKAVFGVTPFAYLTQQRMNQSEQLLRQSNCTMAEIANRVGYANPTQFAAAVKQRFEIK